MAVYNFKFVNRPGATGSLVDRNASNLEEAYTPGNERVELARHHMISWHIIKHCWNTLILPNINGANFPRLNLAMRNYVAFVAIEGLQWAWFDAAIIRDGTQALDRLLNNVDMHSEAPGVPRSPYMMTIARLLCWNPRNIFLGPKGDGHRNYALWETTGPTQGDPRWIRADLVSDFEEYATHIINRKGAGHFHNLWEIFGEIQTQIVSGGAQDQGLAAYINTMIDPVIQPERLEVRHEDWFRMNGFHEQQVWRWGVQAAEYRDMPQLANPPRPSYLVIDDPRILFPVNDGGWQMLGGENVQYRPSLMPLAHAPGRANGPLQGYRPGDRITIGGKTVELESGTDEDDPDYLDAFGKVGDVTLTDAASFLAGPGGTWRLPSIFDGLRVDSLAISYQQKSLTSYSWKLSAAIGFDALGLSMTAIASISAKSDNNQVDSELTIKLPVGDDAITISGTFKHETLGMSALLMADLTTANINISDLLASFLGSNPIPKELETLSITPRKVWFLYTDTPMRSSSVMLDFGPVMLFAGRFMGGRALALRLSTGQLASLSALPFVGSLIPPSLDVAVTDVGLFWASQPFSAPVVSDIVGAQLKIGWTTFYPSYADGAVASGMHAVARLLSKAENESILIQRHLQ